MRTILTLIGAALLIGIIWWAIGRNDGDIANVNGDSNSVVCTMDAKLCPDGSSVGRDPQNNCEFRACPGDDSTDGEDDATVFDKG
jgi:hypothetical protein